MESSQIDTVYSRVNKPDNQQYKMQQYKVQVTVLVFLVAWKNISSGQARLALTLSNLSRGCHCTRCSAEYVRLQFSSFPKKAKRITTCLQ